MSYEGIRFLEELGGEFARVAAEPAPRRRLRVPRRRPLAIAALGLALSGGAIATVVSTRDGADTTGLSGTVARATIAQGTTTSGSSWLLTTGTRPQGSPPGHLPQFCASLRVTTARTTEASVICGPTLVPGKFAGDFAEDPASHERGLIFGTAPEVAAAVAITEGGSSRTVDTIQDDASLPGRFYVAEAGGDYGETRITFYDALGRPLHPAETITEFLRRISE